MGMGNEFTWEGKWFKQSARTMFLLGLYQKFSHTFAYTEACTGDRRGCVAGCLLDHFQKFVVILYNDMPATDIGTKLLQTKTH